MLLSCFNHCRWFCHQIHWKKTIKNSTKLYFRSEYLLSLIYLHKIFFEAKVFIFSCWVSCIFFHSIHSRNKETRFIVLIRNAITLEFYAEWRILNWSGSRSRFFLGLLYIYYVIKRKRIQGHHMTYKSNCGCYIHENGLNQITSILLNKKRGKYANSLIKLNKLPNIPHCFENKIILYEVQIMIIKSATLAVELKLAFVQNLVSKTHIYIYSYCFIYHNII